MSRPKIGHKSGCRTINCSGCGTDFYSVDYSGVTSREQGQGEREMILQIFEQLHPVPQRQNRFRILEVYQSCDGYRTRVSNMSFSTLDAAKDFIRFNNQLRGELK